MSDTHLDVGAGTGLHVHYEPVGVDPLALDMVDGLLACKERPAKHQDR